MDPSGGRVTLLKLEVGKCNWEEFPDEAMRGRYASERAEE
jgi:hypothetical protein